MKSKNKSEKQHHKNKSQITEKNNNRMWISLLGCKKNKKCFESFLVSFCVPWQKKA